MLLFYGTNISLYELIWWIFLQWLKYFFLQQIPEWECFFHKHKKKKSVSFITKMWTTYNTTTKRNIMTRITACLLWFYFFKLSIFVCQKRWMIWNYLVKTSKKWRTKYQTFILNQFDEFDFKWTFASKFPKQIVLPHTGTTHLYYVHLIDLVNKLFHFLVYVSYKQNTFNYKQKLNAENKNKNIFFYFQLKFVWHSGLL